MRLFVAITPTPAVLDELGAEVALLRSAWPHLRWTGPAAWHVTLAFLGEVGEDVAETLGPRLERAARDLKPFRAAPQLQKNVLHDFFGR